jgi:3-methyladenine DNA glycosylase AlkD
MNYRDTLKKLKTMGTAQNRKVYARHGVGRKMYGVSFANLGKLKGAIKTNHELAGKLWTTGNHDARVLATMIADPRMVDSKLLELWAKDIDNYVISDAFSSVAAESPHAKRKADKWSKSKKEYVAATGYNILAGLAMKDGELDDEYFEDYLDRIERHVHKSHNRTRYSMNNALIAIGTRTKKLEKKALATATRIGKVYVDHGETNCSTPDAIEYIPKAAAHRAKKSAKAKSKAKAKVKAKKK